MRTYAKLLAASTLACAAICVQGDGERKFRDVEFRCDLSRSVGIAFDFSCEDIRAVSAFSVYLKSGDGWYSGSFHPVLTSRWNRVEVGKERFAVSEGAPAGWSKVDTLRLALWRSGTNDTAFGIDRISAIRQDPEIVVLRGDYSQSRRPQDPHVLQASEMTERLRAAGFAVTEVSDRELSCVDLSGIDLAVLPYNSHLPSATLGALQKFRSSGGRLLVCRGMPDGIPEIMGIVRRPDIDERTETDAGIYLKSVWKLRGEESDRQLALLLGRLVPKWRGRCDRLDEKAREASERSRSWLASQKGRAGEWRAYWCADGKRPAELSSWDEAARKLRQNGFTAVLPNLARAGDVFPAEECLAACRRHGLECHVWKVCWRTGGDATNKPPGALQVSFDGRENRRWMCPSDPSNQAAEAEDFLRLARQGPTGVHMDYIRYPGPDSCFCGGCRRRFERMFSLAVTNWPGAVRSSAVLAEKWTEFRCSNVTALVRAVSNRVRRETPGVRISAAVFAKQASSRKTYGQDWVAWCREGLVDFVCPMDYWSASPEAFGLLVRGQKAAVRGTGVKLRPGIGVSCWRTTEDDAVRAAREIQEVRACGLDGFAVFSLDKRGAAVLSHLRTGMTSDVQTNVVISENESWIRLKTDGSIDPGSALDFSRMGFRDPPAGRHGWLRNVDGHFEFEGLPGRRQRFYGANLCMSAVAPTHGESDRLVAQFVRMGYNAVRIHHQERTLSGDGPGLSLDADAMERFDYLVAKCIAAGLYLTTDLYVSRTVTWKEIGLPQRGSGAIPDMQLYKSLVQVWKPAFSNWCQYAKLFLSHVNPYTGRRYADEPAMPLISMMNEGQLSSGWKGAAKGEDPVLGAAWRAFLKRRRAENPDFCPDAPEDFRLADPLGKDNAAFVHFNAAIERRSATRMKAFLRGIGVKALLTSENCPPDNAPVQSVREDVYDYVDNHFYVGHPQFLGGSWKLPAVGWGKSPVESGCRQMCKTAFSRVAGLPFTVSEWNFPGPSRFRGAAGVLCGAFAALQDWDGLWRFCYASAREHLSAHGSPSFFAVATDPLALATERALVELFLRGDMSAAPVDQAYRIGQSLMSETGGRISEVAPAAWCTDAWHCRMSTTCGERGGLDLAKARMSNHPPFSTETRRNFGIDRENGNFWVDTLRTSGGFSSGGTLDCGGVSFFPGGQAATVWASAADPADSRLDSAQRILLTHLTDLQGDGATYADDSCQKLLRFGSGRYLVRKGVARVFIRLKHPERYAVWGLDSSGVREERLDASAEAGGLVFTVNSAGAFGGRLYYEISRTSRPHSR